MRNSDGIYEGHHVCNHYIGLDRFEERECCGGKRMNAAYVSCDVKGVILAEPFCSSSGCEVFKRERRLLRSAQKD